jgi:hypothetical protein
LLHKADLTLSLTSDSTNTHGDSRVGRQENVVGNDILNFANPGALLGLLKRWEGAKEGSLDCVKFILAMPNADINAPGLKKVGHLYRAAIDQRLEIVRYFLENEHHEPDLHQANGLYANGATALFGGNGRQR